MTWLFAPTPHLVLTNVAGPDSVNYRVVITNSEGAVTSAVAHLTVLIPPSVTRQPKDATASLFADATFSITASGTTPLSYQWRFNGTALSEMTNSTLKVVNVQRTNAGNYTVVVTNFAGAVTSQVATLTIVPFNSLHLFGHSWTDTDNCGSIWGSRPNYWNHRASNGPLWPEFLSTNLGLIYTAAHNFAHCATESSEVFAQIADYPRPVHAELSLSFAWVGDAEWLGAATRTFQGCCTPFIAWTNDVGWSNLVQKSLRNSSNMVERLYLKGARFVVLENLFDWSRAPGLSVEFGTNVARTLKYRSWEERFNTGLSAMAESVLRNKPDLRLMIVDIYSKLNEVLANPAQFGFTVTTNDALDDPNLTNKSFDGPGADYVYWDELGHFTLKLHELTAAWHMEMLTNAILEKLELGETNGSLYVQMNHLQIGRDYVLQASSELSQWQDVQSFTASAGTNRFIASFDAAPAKFYRLKWGQ